MLGFNKRVVVGFIAVAIVFSYWYFFVDTLTLSEVIGEDVDSKAGIFMNLFDFDTDLTRYDVRNLKSKAPYWEKRFREIDSLSDNTRRKRERDKLMAEITKDSAMKKIVNKTSGFGVDAVLAILNGM